MWSWPKHSPFKKDEQSDGEEESRFCHCPHMPIMRVRVREDKEGKRWVGVFVFTAASSTQEQKYLAFTSKTPLYFWHTLHPSKSDSFPTDWLPELNSRPRRRCPRHLAKIEKYSDDIAREWSCLQNRLSFFTNNRLCRNWKSIHL